MGDRQKNFNDLSLSTQVISKSKYQVQVFVSTLLKCPFESYTPPKNHFKLIFQYLDRKSSSRLLLERRPEGGFKNWKLDLNYHTPVHITGTRMLYIIFRFRHIQNQNFKFFSHFQLNWNQKAYQISGRNSPNWCGEKMCLHHKLAYFSLTYILNCNVEILFYSRILRHQIRFVLTETWILKRQSVSCYRNQNSVLISSRKIWFRCNLSEKNLKLLLELGSNYPL